LTVFGTDEPGRLDVEPIVAGGIEAEPFIQRYVDFTVFFA
jgi:hypothetical protein